MPEQVWYVYLLLCADGSIYTGISIDPDRRVAEHKAGTGSLHTRDRKVGRLLWTERHPDPLSARRRELQLKGWTRRKKLALANGDLQSLKQL